MMFQIQLVFFRDKSSSIMIKREALSLKHQKPKDTFLASFKQCDGILSVYQYNDLSLLTEY